MKGILHTIGATFFLIGVLQSNIIYCYLPFISSILYIYSSLCLFCSIRIVTDIRTQDLFHSLPIFSRSPNTVCLYQQELIFVFSLFF